MSSRLAHIPPGRIILSSLLITILLGTFALSLPIAQKASFSFLDLLFTATSATCVTGLFTIPIEQFTVFGQGVILALIQIGGLGLITMTLFFLSLFLNVGYGTQLMIGHIFELETAKNIKKTLFFIIIFTMLCELIGAIILFPIFLQKYSLNYSLFLAIFHAISAFCNAGISVLPEGLSYFIEYKTLLCTIGLLMFAGGLGFFTWVEIFKYVHNLLTGKRYRFSLQSKIILYGTSALIMCTAVMFWILEHDNSFAYFTPLQTMIISLFNAISFRSSGFLIFSPTELQMATILMILVLSFIGSSPGSTGSGIKLTTFSLFLATIKSVIKNRSTIEIQGRTIPNDLIFKSISIIGISLGWILLTTFCLLITEENAQFFDILFEAASAFTNLGVTTGVTVAASSIGKLFLMLSMLFGRIGSLTLVLALKLRKKESVEFTYPEERVMLG